MAFKTYTPRHKVTLKRVDNGRLPEDISADVTSIATHKRYGEVGTFTLTTTYNRRYNKKTYDRLVSPGDMILIELDEGAGEGLLPTMLGLVSGVERHTQVDGAGIPQRSVCIQGSDFTKLLQEHHCMWPAAISKDANKPLQTQIEAEYGVSLITGGTPDTVAKTIVATEVHKRMPWTAQYLKLDYMTLGDDWLTITVPISTQETVWGILTNIANKPYNTLHCDTGDDGLAYIYIEPCPFDDITGKLHMTADILHNVTLAEVISEQMGRNDNDRITYFYNQVYANIFNTLGDGTLLFTKGENVRNASEADMQNYGFRPWIIQTNYVPFNADNFPPAPSHLVPAPPNTETEIGKRTEALWAWNKDNHKLESGTMEIHGKPQIKCGEGVIYKDNGFEYFVEQVAHTYRVTAQGGLFRTNLHLTRGQKREN